MVTASAQQLPFSTKTILEKQFDFLENHYRMPRLFRG